MPEYPTGTVTFLFTDIEQSTQLLQRLGDAYPGVLEQHNKIIRTAIGRAGGVVVSTAGDSFFAVFPEAWHALNAAVAAQRSLATYDWPQSAPVRVRMGLHSGTATVDGGLYTGLDINRAARISSAAYGGQVLISGSVYRQIHQQLPEGVSLLDLGMHRFKDLAEPEHIYQVVIPGMASDFPPIRSLDALTQSLPVVATNFVGRQEELVELNRLLADPHTRLITILGPGGIGKSRLCIEAARRHAEYFVDGIVFVPLANVELAASSETIDPFLAAMADALEMIFGAGAPPLSQMLDQLRPRQLLILLDNFEHLLDSAATVTAILTSAPRVKVMVTSRERLNLPEEWLFTLGGLPYPEPDAGIVPSGSSELTGAQSYAALELFEQRARQAAPDFDLAREEACASRICQLVEGMPLGIELAATWLRMMSCQDIVAEIQKSIDFLSTDMRTVPSRHRSVRAVFENSWQSLAAQEQTVLAKLSIFRGGFDRNAAEAVADASIWSLSSLVDKSMLQSNSGGRYGVHELLRQLAEEKLVQTAGDYEAARQQHAAYFCSLLKSQEANLKGSGDRIAFKAITANIENIRMAWRWVVEHAQLEPIGQAMEALSDYYEMQGRYVEGEDAFDLALGGLRSVHKERTSSPEIDLVLGRALTYQAWFSTRLGRFQVAADNFAESLSLLQRVSGDVRFEIALNRFYWGVALFLAGEYRSADPIVRESLAGFQGLDDSWGCSLALVVLAQITQLVGRYAEAERYTRESLVHLEKIGNRHTKTYAISTLGRIATALGQYEQAETYNLECLKLRTELGDQGALAFTLRDLGYISLLQGHVERARDYYQQCLDLAEKTGASFSKIQALWGLAKVAHALGRFDEAKRWFRESLTLSEVGGLVLQLVDGCLADVGWTNLALEEYDDAAEFFTKTVRIALEHQAIPVMLDALAGLAVFRAKREPGATERCVAVLSGIRQHPACHQETKDRTAGIVASFVDSLSPESASSARSRGSELDMLQVATDWADATQD